MGIEFPNQKPRKKTDTPSIGSDWSAVQNSNDKKNPIFDFNKDGKIQESEYITYKQSQKQGKNLSRDEAYEYLDLEGYTIEALRKRYPPDKYEIKESQDKSNRLRTVIDKSKNYTVLTFSEIMDNNEEITNYSILEWNENHEIWIKRDYNASNKTIISSVSNSFNGLYQYPIIDLIHDDICAKTKLGLPTTGKDLEKHINYIDYTNILEMMTRYEKKYGQTLIDAINNEIGLNNNTKKRILNHIIECLKRAYNYQEGDFSRESIVSNENHTGEPYLVSQKGNILTAVNQRTGKISSLNLHDMCKNFPPEQQIALKANMQNLPREVIADFVSEGITHFNRLNLFYKYVFKLEEIFEPEFPDKYIDAFYNPLVNKITLKDTT